MGSYASVGADEVAQWRVQAAGPALCALSSVGLGTHTKVTEWGAISIAMENAGWPIDGSVFAHVDTGWDRFPGPDPAPAGPELFELLSYPHFAFFAGARNDWGAPPIAEPRGLPEDASDYTRYFHFDPHRRNEPRGGDSASWLRVEELIGFDHD
jgi:hypothetical protein